MISHQLLVFENSRSFLTVFRRQLVKGVFVDVVPSDHDVDTLALHKVDAHPLVLLPIPETKKGDSPFNELQMKVLND